MKLTFLSLLCHLAAYTFAQQAEPVITTEEEYNYITRGYEMQVQGGLDMKKGYKLLDMTNNALTHGVNKYNVSFKELIRESTGKSCAIMMILETNRSSKAYFCIPTFATQSLWDRTLSQLEVYSFSEEGPEIFETMIWALMHYSSFMINDK